MKTIRKKELLGQFPDVPSEILENMKHGDIFGKARSMNFCVFLTNGHELFVRCYHKYSRSCDITESQRYVFAKDGFARYGWSKDKGWHSMAFREPVFYKSLYYVDNSYTILNAACIYRSNMRYSRVFEWAENSSFCVISYLRLYCKHPNIEYLVESGYERLIYIQTDYYGKCKSVGVTVEDIKSNNLLKMLGLSKAEFKLLRGNEKLYTKYIITRGKLLKLKAEDLFEIAKSPFYADDLIRCSKPSGSTVMRMYRYLTDNNISAIFYRDYIEQCEKLGYNMHDTSIAFPHDFHAVHERFSQIIKYQECEKDKQEFAKRIEARKVFEYESGDLILRQPQCYEEIIEEGKALCHCVGGYAARHSRGKTNIFFIRKKSDPLKPYYTIEVSNSFKIVQCYGYKNNRTIAKSDEIKAFEQEYQSYLEELKHERNNIKSA